MSPQAYDMLKAVGVIWLAIMAVGLTALIPLLIWWSRIKRRTDRAKQQGRKR